MFHVLHPHLSLKEFPASQKEINDLYVFFMQSASVQVTVSEGQKVAVVQEFPSSDIMDEIIEVSVDGPKTIFGMDLKFDVVIGDLVPDSWACIHQIKNNVAVGVVFVNISGMALSITQEGDVSWTCKGVKLVGNLKVKPKLTSVTSIT